MLLEEEVINMKNKYTFLTFQSVIYSAYKQNNLSEELYIKYSEDI